MAMDITLGGISIKQPTKFDIEKYNLTKSGRVASGLMKMEIIAKKRKFLFQYDVISGTDLDTILGVIDTNTAFFTIGYKENEVAKTATVYSGAISATRFRTDGKWYWKDVKFDLIEQ